MGKTLLLALVLGLLSSSLADSVGVGVCGIHDIIVKSLWTTYREKSVSVGLENGFAAIETLASNKGTFTILRTATSGWSCVIAAGKDYEPRPQHSMEGEI